MTIPSYDNLKPFRPLFSVLIVVAAFVFAGCGDDPSSEANQDNDDNDDPEVEYAVGGTVSGLEAEGLVLHNNGDDDLEIDADGAFVFATTLADGEDYDVTVAEEPEHHDCQVDNGSGTIDGSDVDDVEVGCEFDEPPPADDAEFAVDIDEEASTVDVEETQTVEIVAIVENQSDFSDEQTLTFSIDGNGLEVQDVELDAEETDTVHFEWETSPGDAGEYLATVSSDFDSGTVEVTVDESDDVDVTSYFDVSIEDSSTLEVDEEDTVVVDVVVTNDGDDVDTQDIELLVGGEVEDVYSDLQLDSGQFEEFSLEWETSAGDEGYHSAEVRSDDDAQTVTVTVGEPDDEDATVTGTVTDASTGSNLEGVDVLLFEEGEASPVDTDTTGASGAYSFSGVEAGDYEIVLEAPGLEPNYEIEEAGAESVLDLSISGGLVEQDLTVEWLRTTDLIIDGGVLEINDGDGDSFDVPFLGCEQADDGSWEPQEPDIDDDDVELSFDPDDECYRINDVSIDIATGVLTASPSEVIFPTIEIYMEEEETDEIDAIEAELEWLVDDVGGVVDFADGSMDVDLDVRILVGGTAHALLNIDFGARDGNMDCQLTGAWGGDIDNPQEDTANEQIGDYLHDPIELRLTTEDSGTSQGVPYDPDVGLAIVIDHEVVIDRISEGPIGSDDPGGPACGDIDLLGNQADFAEEFNQLLDLPAGPGDVLVDFHLWVD